MALHVGGHIKETAHQVARHHIIIDPLLVVKKHFHQPFGVGVLHLSVVVLLVALPAFLFNDTLPGLVQVVLERLADIIMNLCSGIGSSQFLTLGYHRKDTAEYGGRARIDLQVLCLENLREILCHALADAMVLALTNRRQVTQTLLGC